MSSDSCELLPSLGFVCSELAFVVGCYSADFEKICGDANETPRDNWVGSKGFGNHTEHFLKMR
jgi:hypothetical protein